MTEQELISALRRMKVETGSLACFCCGHEHNCSVHGCAIIRAAVDKLTGFEWLDPEIEIPPDSDAVLGIVNGDIKGIECIDAYHLVCYDSGEWWLFDDPSIDVNVYRWMPLPEPPREGNVK